MCKHSNSRCIDSRGQATAGHAPGPVTVDWATADGTAEAGADYEAARDTLSFAAGETGKTVEVASIDDHEHEESETLTPTLSRPRRAEGRATGRITNTDVIPGAWLAGGPGLRPARVPAWRHPCPVKRRTDWRSVIRYHMRRALPGPDCRSDYAAPIRPAIRSA